MMLQHFPAILSDIPFPQSFTPQTRTQTQNPQTKPIRKLQQTTETQDLNFDLHLKSMSNPTKNCTHQNNLQKKQNWKLE
jgi:hypothetical protein